MSTILVSILSNHTLPNFLFIKEMQGQFDELLFITTPEIEASQRHRQIEAALQLPEDTAVFTIVDGNNFQKTLHGLSAAWEVRNDDKYIVNLTGGTKVMSLAVHEFFSKLDTRFCYVPIGTNTYYDLDSEECHPLHYRASLRDYFTLYGIRFESTPEPFSHKQEEVYSIFEECRQRKWFLPDRLHNAQAASTAELRRFYAGEWFELFAYFKLKEVFDLNTDTIALSAKIYHKGGEPTNDNELDVVYIYDNQLHVVECKVTMNGYDATPRDTVEKYLYKMAAINKDFGLQVKSYLFTLHKMSKFSKETRLSFGKRCGILGIEGIVSGVHFANLKSSLYNRQTLRQ